MIIKTQNENNFKLFFIITLYWGVAMIQRVNGEKNILCFILMHILQEVLPNKLPNHKKSCGCSQKTLSKFKKKNFFNFCRELSLYITGRKSAKEPLN
jgi:hypothetical protein